MDHNEVIRRLEEVSNDEEAAIIDQAAHRAGFRWTCAIGEPPCQFVNAITEILCGRCGAACPVGTAPKTDIHVGWHGGVTLCGKPIGIGRWCRLAEAKTKATCEICLCRAEIYAGPAR